MVLTHTSYVFEVFEIILPIEVLQKHCSGAESGSVQRSCHQTEYSEGNQWDGLVPAAIVVGEFGFLF